jgi:Transcriptional regulator
MSDQTLRRNDDKISASILQTTESLFSKYGVENVSMHQIAKAANVGQGTMYRRYANKGDLCMDLMKDHFQDLQNSVHRFLESAESLPVKERLLAVFQELIRFMEKYAHLFEMIQSYPISRCEHTRTRFFKSPPYVFMHSVITSLLEEAIRSETARPVNADFTAHMLMASINPKVYIFLKKEKGYTTDEIIKNFNRTFLEPLFL